MDIVNEQGSEMEIPSHENEDNEHAIKESNDYRYAGFWMRFWAYLFDIIVLFGVNSFLLSPFKFVNDGLPVDIWLWTWNGLFAGAIYYVYFLLMTKFFGQTIGKMILGLKVVQQDEHNKNLSWYDVIFREVVGRFIYNAFLILKLLYVVIGFTNEKQGLHDILGSTRVVHESSM